MISCTLRDGTTLTPDVLTGSELPQSYGKNSLSNVFDYTVDNWWQSSTATSALLRLRFPSPRAVEAIQLNTCTEDGIFTPFKIQLKVWMVRNLILLTVSLMG